jgi:hypothetical protein
LKAVQFPRFQLPQPTGFTNNRGERIRNGTEDNVAEVALRPALDAFAEELALPVLQIPFIADLTLPEHAAFACSQPQWTP